MFRRVRPHIRNSRGSASVELCVMLVAVFLPGLFMVLAFGRIEQGHVEVQAAARYAARAVTMARPDDDREGAGTAIVQSRLQGAGITCKNGAAASTAISISPQDTGDIVTVNIQCDVDLSDLIKLGVPGTHSINYTYTEIADPYRYDPAKA